MKPAAWLFLVCLGAAAIHVMADAGDDAAAEKQPSPAASPAAVDDDAAAPEEGGGVVPPPFPVSRYASLWERSPFQLESIAPPVESAGLAQKYALTGIAQVNGEPIVFLLDRATQIRHMVEKKANKAGLALVRVNMEKKSDDSTAVVSQGGEVGVVKFDVAAVTAGAMLPMGMQAQGPGAHGRPFFSGQNPAALQPQMPGTGVQPAVPGVAGNPSPQGMPTQMPQVAPAQTPDGQNPAVPGQPNPAVVPNQFHPPVPGQGGMPGQGGPSPRIIRRRALIPAMP